MLSACTALDNYCCRVQTYLWPVVDYPVELDNDAGLSITEAKCWVVLPRAASQQRLAKAARFPLSCVTLHISAVSVCLRNVCA